MSDWRSYDTIAARYDDVWGMRFAEAARHLWRAVRPEPGAAVLDLGTGTGIVPRALAAAGHHGTLVACDTAPGMLRVARTRLPVLHAVAASAVALPFARGFDVVTASFLLSHLRDHAGALREAHRVLRPSGVFAMTSWMPNTDPYSESWGGLLSAVVSPARLQEGTAEIVPAEAYFESPGRVGAALEAAGFADVQVHTVAIECRFSLDDYLADRELSGGGRFARHVLGDAGWRRFVAGAREALRDAFGEGFRCDRGCLVGVGQRR